MIASTTEQLYSVREILNMSSYFYGFVTATVLLMFTSVSRMFMDFLRDRLNRKNEK